MSLLVVGSVALDSVETPFGRTENALGGSAVFFGCAGSLLYPVQMVGVVGRDYPMAELKRLAERGLDLRGVTVADGESFRWAGKYGFDLSTRDTLETRLGVFANFKPVIPPEFRDAEYVFLGNIDPELQLEVLEQVRKPKVVACDTMNYWIQGKRTALMKLLEHVDVLLVNDSEVRELSGDWHIHRAARWVLNHGPRYVVVKKGEHGAVLVEKDRIFYVPAFPLDDVFDPTGAGDSFAGGFMAQLARTGDVSDAGLRLAMVYGSAMGSFAVERFSVGRFEEITLADVVARVRAYRDLVHFELDAASADAGRR
ncbi:MAG TPA: PfkB family carbohydrate kinase [Gemmatimonadales bacterium]|nr:PfkB family carbohydrate kinase [Gemmatimonadales bacterium]